MKKFSEEDKEKIKKLLEMLKGREGEENSEADFLCTHCHCKVCSTVKETSESKLGLGIVKNGKGGKK